MNKVNRGKQFEAQISKALTECLGCAFVRLRDSTLGYAGVANPCDFVAYYYPYIYFFECKSCYGNTLPFANISKNQYSSLLDFSVEHGVIAGYLIWFIDHDITVFIEARDLDDYRATGKKSVNINDILNKKLRHVIIYGQKKRILFDYKIIRFFEHVIDYKGDYAE